MANFLKDNDDLRFYIDKWIDWESLVDAVEFGYQLPDGPESLEEARELYGDMLELVGDFVANEVAPRSAAVDRKKVKLVDGEVEFSEEHNVIFDQLAEMGMHALCLPRELGGMNAPLMLYMINAEMFARADVSMMTHHSFHGGIAMAMLVYSIREGSTEFDRETMEITKTRFADEIAEIASGATCGCMDITEPNAGSDMAALSTKAVQDDDGNWFVTGQKIFITSGNGKYHFVIARTEDAGDPDNPMAGLGGLSFFLVPAYEDLPDGTRKRLATVDRIEEKLGHHGSPTCSIIFENTPAYLVGERGEGFKQMLLLMNNARVGVGFESLGLCEAAYRLAKDYAAERVSMGKTIDKHEMIADYLDGMKSDIAAVRALAMHGCFHEEMAQRVEMRVRYLTDEGSLERKRLEKQLKHHQWEARRVTPLLKYLAAEKAVDMGRMAVQIHGGVGYTKEYGAEKLLRDAMVMPIYEGTSQIQSLMAMKDGLGKVMKNPQAFVKEAAQTRWRAMSSQDGLERRVAKMQSLHNGAVQALIARTATDKFRSVQSRPIGEWPDAFLKDWNPKKDFAYAMLHAERLIKLNCHATVCGLFWEQAKEHPERREVLEAYLDRYEPQAKCLHEEITSRGGRILSMLAGGAAADAAE